MKQLIPTAIVWTAGFVAGVFAATWMAQLKAERASAAPTLPAIEFSGPKRLQLREGRGPALIFPDGQFPNAIQTEKGLKVAL